MSVASTVTKLPLATFARIFGMHPLHFEQVRLPDSIALADGCSQIYFQHSWQTSDHVSREEIAIAIAEAEDRIERELGFRLAPSWEVDEWNTTTRPFASEFNTLNMADVRGRRQAIGLDWGYFISGGVEKRDLIEEESSIEYSDENEDGYSETATVSVQTDSTNKNEIRIFYPGHNGDPAWEIRPTKVSFEDDDAVITFRRELVVVESKLEAYDITGGEAVGDDDEAFLSSVDVYRVWNDPQTQASLLWEPLAGGACRTCEGSGCNDCSYATSTGCLILRGTPRSSLVGINVANWDEDDEIFVPAGAASASLPDIVRAYYKAGFRDMRQEYTDRMAREWETVVAHMAASLLDRPPCDCAKGDWNKYREDLTLISGDEDGKPFFRQPDGVLDNPFGSRRGEVEAWRKVKAFKIAHAVRL